MARSLLSVGFAGYFPHPSNVNNLSKRQDLRKGFAAARGLGGARGRAARAYGRDGTSKFAQNSIQFPLRLNRVTAEQSEKRTCCVR